MRPFPPPSQVSLSPISLLVLPVLPPRQTDKQRTRKTDRERDWQRQKLPQPLMCRAQASLFPQAWQTHTVESSFHTAAPSSSSSCSSCPAASLQTVGELPSPHARRMTPYGKECQRELAGTYPQHLSARDPSSPSQRTLSLGGRALVSSDPA